MLDAPAHMVAELVDGALRLQPRPASRHARASTSLGVELGGWWLLDEPELHLDEDVLVPDLAGWRRARMPEPPDAAFFDLAPDWVCAILSSSTRAFDLVEKRDRHAAAHVGWLWLVDPAARTLEAFALTEGSWVLLGALGGEGEVRLAPFDAVGFPLDALWP